MSDAAPAASRLVRFTTTALRQLRPSLSWRSTTLWIIIAVNVALIVLYFWSRGGATTEVRIEAIGTQYRVFVDGQLAAEGDFQGRGEGGIGFRLSGDHPVHSLPGPSGIDSVRVTDADTGEVIFEDRFSGSQPELWEVESGDWQVRGGVYTTSTRGVVTTGVQPWGDYVLEARLRNVKDASVYVRTVDSRNAVIFNMRPFRHYDSWLSLLENGSAVERQGGGRLQLDRGQTFQSMMAMLLRPYPVAALMVVGAIVLAFSLRLSWVERRLQAAGQFVLGSANTIVFALAAGAFVLLWYLTYVVGEAMPHVPDSVLYVFQAKIFASFKLTADAPPVRESFSMFHPHMLQVVDGRWFSHYPFGHPLFLSIGQLFGAVWLVPPVLGAASVALIYWVGKRIYGVMVGLLAAVLLLFSPFFQMTASNFMSHNTAAFVILASLFFLTRPLKRHMLSMFLSGVFLGLLFNIRPLVGTTLVPVFGLFMGYELLRAGNERGKLFREDLAFAAGGALLLLAYFFYNQATTGDFLKSQYALQGTFTSDAFGFGGRHSVAFGLQDEQLLLSLMLLVANGWPVAIGLTFAALPFVLASKHRWDYFLAASALALAVTPILYQSAAVMHGPRFWYETMPFLILLTARGAQCLRDAGSAAGDWLAGRLGRAPPVSTVGVTSFAVTSLVVGLVVFSAWGWMLERRDAWPGIQAVPQKISQLEGFNFADRRLLDQADALDLENALVLVEHCPNWWCYGTVFWTNSPDLDGDIVWAERQKRVDDIELLGHFEGRDLYLADHGTASILPVTRAEILGSVQVQEPAPKPGPPLEETDAASASERDLIRRRDLEIVRQALERYAEQTGGYPDTGGLVQTLCVFRQLDAGCALKTVLPELPSDPLGSAASNGYWYLSDVTSFVLLARQETMEVDQNQCPENLAHLAGAPTLYCVPGPAP